MTEEGRQAVGVEGALASLVHYMHYDDYDLYVLPVAVCDWQTKDQRSDRVTCAVCLHIIDAWYRDG